MTSQSGVREKKQRRMNRFSVFTSTAKKEQTANELESTARGEWETEGSSPRGELRNRRTSNPLRIQLVLTDNLHACRTQGQEEEEMAQKWRISGIDTTTDRHFLGTNGTDQANE